MTGSRAVRWLHAGALSWALASCGAWGGDAASRGGVTAKLKENRPPETPEEALSRSTLFFDGRGMQLAVGFPLNKAFSPIPTQWPPQEIHELVETPSYKRALRVVTTFAFGGLDDRSKLLTDEWGLLMPKGVNSPRGLMLADPPIVDPANAQELRLLVMGCAACHYGRAAGVDYPGLGNKNIDIYRLAEDLRVATPMFVKLRTVGDVLGSLPKTTPTVKELDDRALRFAERLGHPSWSNLTQGLVPTSQIFWWFYDQEAKLPPSDRKCVTKGTPALPEDAPRGQVRVPHLWGFDARRGEVDDTDPSQAEWQTGLFCDAYGTGLGWAGGAELGAGPDRATITDPAYIKRVELLAETIKAAAKPPMYPFPVNVARAKAGKALFEGEDLMCSSCHGRYPRDAQGTTIPKAPKVIPYRDDTDPSRSVLTDPTRLLMTAGGKYADTYNCLVDSFSAPEPSGPYAGSQRLARAKPKPEDAGYIAPRLDGIWARFPYLHNGSVPSVRALLTPPKDRPKVFSVRDAGEAKAFDARNLGLHVPDKSQAATWTAELQAAMDAMGGDCGTTRDCQDPDPARRALYWTARPEQSNTGHYYWTTVSTEDQDAIIEYLKTLGACPKALASGTSPCKDL